MRRKPIYGDKMEYNGDIHIYIYNKQIWGFEWDLPFENYISGLVDPEIKLWCFLGKQLIL